MVKEAVKLFTSESVSEGHVDAVCDAISNYLQDKYAEGDKYSRIAIETAIFGRNIFVGGEVTSKTEVDVVQGVKDVLNDIGYDPEDGYVIQDHIIGQSPEISEGVTKDDGEVGAGDNGLMFGYATNGLNTEYMPMGAYLSHQLALKLSEVRKTGVLDYLGPDGKTQVTVKLNKDNEFVGVDTVVVNSMHSEEVSLEKVREDIKREVIDVVMKENDVYSEDIKVMINTAGSFVLGFGDADAGLTGRKIIVNSYCGYAKHGGGNYNGKDASKVDRSGAYMARYLSKNILHDAKTRYSNLNPQEVEVQFGFAIGIVEPVSLNVEVRSKGELLEDVSQTYQKFIENNISCSVKGIIETLDLLNQKMYPTSAYGHFGRPEFTWEKLDIDFSGIEN